MHFQEGHLMNVQIFGHFNRQNWKNSHKIGHRPENHGKICINHCWGYIYAISILIKNRRGCCSIFFGLSHFAVFGRVSIKNVFFLFWKNIFANLDLSWHCQKEIRSIALIRGTLDYIKVCILLALRFGENFEMPFLGVKIGQFKAKMVWIVKKHPKYDAHKFLSKSERWHVKVCEFT